MSMVPYTAAGSLLTPRSKPAEYMPIEDTYSPVLHRLNQAIRRRGIQPDEPVGPPADILTKYSTPPAELVSEAAPQLKKLVTAADVKKGSSPLPSPLPFPADPPQSRQKPRASVAAARSPSPSPGWMSSLCWAARSGKNLPPPTPSRPSSSCSSPQTTPSSSRTLPSRWAPSSTSSSAPAWVTSGTRRRSRTCASCATR